MTISPDDQQFADMFMRVNLRKGYGPLHIKHGLKEMLQSDLPMAAIDGLLASLDVNWQDQAENIRHQQFDGDKPTDLQQQIQQIRFLLNRGFPADTVQMLFPMIEIKERCA